MEIKALFNQVNSDASQAHLAHLSTKCFAEHLALGDFYEGARDKLDALIETGIGIGVKVEKPSSQLEAITEGYMALYPKRAAICNGVKVLEMQFDELLAVYTHAMYMLQMKTESDEEDEGEKEEDEDAS